MSRAPRTSGHTPVLGRDGALALGASAVEAALAAGVLEAEAVIMTEDSGLARYAGDRVHQHVSERNCEIRVRAVRGRRVAVTAGNQADTDSVRAVAERAAAAAGRSPEDPYFPGLPHPSSTPYVDQTTFYASTAELEPADRAEAVRIILGLLKSAGAQGFGAVTSAVTELAVVNSHGVHAYQSFTDAWVSVIAQRERYPAGEGAAVQTLTTSGRAGGAAAPSSRAPLRPATGRATACHRDWSEIDPESTALRALSKASLETPRHLPPGEYTVLLEETAVAEMLEFLAYGALNGLNFLEGQSLYSGRLGERPYPATITLRDDPTDARATNFSFDFEGVPKAPLTLIRGGVLERVAWDSATAARGGEASTGHALPAPNPHGPMPLNLTLLPGSHDRAELLAKMDRGLLVTRFHYVNEVDPARTLLTGMTRDGTFLVEDGKIVAPVQDLRWVESIDGVLKRTIAVGSTQQLVSEGPGYGMRSLVGSLMPALLVEGFSITGSADPD